MGAYLGCIKAWLLGDQELKAATRMSLERLEVQMADLCSADPSTDEFSGLLDRIRASFRKACVNMKVPIPPFVPTPAEGGDLAF